MKKQEFIELYNTCKLSELTKILGCSVPTIYKCIEKYDIPKKGQGSGKRLKRKLDLE